MPRIYGFLYTTDINDVRSDLSLSSNLKAMLRNRKRRAQHRGGDTTVRIQVNGGEMAGYTPTVLEIVSGGIQLRSRRGKPFSTETDLSGLPVIEL